MAILELVILGCRALQFLFAVIVLGLTGHVVSYGGASPSQNNFMLFTAIWTILVLIYLVAAPRFLGSIANVIALFAVELLTMLFWFAAFVALAVFHSNLVAAADFFYIGGCSAIGDVCGVVTAAVVFGAFEWALFISTTIFAALAAFRNRGNMRSGHGTATAPSTV